MKNVTRYFSATRPDKIVVQLNEFGLIEILSGLPGFLVQGADGEESDPKVITVDPLDVENLCEILREAAALPDPSGRSFDCEAGH